MKDSTNNQHASSGGSGVIIPDVEKYTEDLGQQVTNSHMPAVVAVQGPWDFGRSFLMTRLEEYLCGSGDGKAPQYFGIRITVPEYSDDEDGSGKVLTAVLQGMEKGCTDVMNELQIPSTAVGALENKTRKYLMCFESLKDGSVLDVELLFSDSDDNCSGSATDPVRAGQDPSRQLVDDLKAKAWSFLKNTKKVVSSEAVKAGVNAIGLDGESAMSFLKGTKSVALSEAVKAGVNAIGLDGESVLGALGADSEIFKKTSCSLVSSVAKELAEAFSQAVDNCLKIQPECRGFMFLIDGLENVSPDHAIQDLDLLKDIFDVRNSVFVLGLDSAFVAKGLESESDSALRDPAQFIGRIASSSFVYPVTPHDVTVFLEDALKNAGCFSAEDFGKEISFNWNVNVVPGTVQGIIDEMTRLSVGPDVNKMSQVADILSSIKGSDSDQSGSPALDVTDYLTGYGLGCLLVAYPEIYDYVVQHPGAMVWNEDQIKHFQASRFLIPSLLGNTTKLFKNLTGKPGMTKEGFYTCNDSEFGIELPSLNASKLLVIIRALTDQDQLEERIRRLTSLISENMEAVPEDEADSVGISERRQATLDTRYSFWESFISYAFENPEFAAHFKKKKPTQGRWITFGVDATGCHIGVVLNLRRNELRVELFIRDDRKLYFTLASQKGAIEAEAGLKFEWRDVGGKNSSVRIENHSFTLTSEGERHKQFDWLIDVILRMRNTFVKYL
jgi:hypothetical protein